MKKLLGLLLAVLVMASCVSLSTVMLDKTLRFDPVRPEDVRVFLDEKDVKGQFVKIAIIKGEGTEVVTTEEQILKNFKEKAGSLGANAIIYLGAREPNDTQRWANRASGGLGFGSRQATAIAIRITE